MTLPLIIILLPAYNEESAIGPLLDRIHSTLLSFPHQIVVVDDGSTDRTVQVILKRTGFIPVEVLKRPKNGGLGIALLEGLLHLLPRCKGDELLVTMDADNTFDPLLIPQMVKGIEEGADVVIASRYAPGGSAVGVPFLRRFLTAGIRLLLSLVFYTKNIRDYTCGYRCYRMELLQRLSKRYQPLIRARGFSATAEILLKALSENAECREIPFILRYDLKLGRSKLRLSQTIAEYIQIIGFTRLEIWRTGKKQC